MPSRHQPIWIIFKKLGYLKENRAAALGCKIPAEKRGSVSANPPDLILITANSFQSAGCMA